jgi:hypothetical protein
MVAAEPAAATITLEIPDKTGRKKLPVQAAVKYHEVELLRPSKNNSQYESVTLTAIEIKEVCNDPSKTEEDTLHWKLLTTLSIQTVADALQCVKWYTYRWLIERFHYVLKSGTKIEDLQLKQAESLQKAIGVYSLSAFRIMLLTYQSRNYPNVSCEVILTPEQWKVLYVLIHQTKEMPQQPPTLQQAVAWIGRLGGHLGRKSDGPPGLKTVWLGYKRVCDAANIYALIAT